MKVKVDILKPFSNPFPSNLVSPMNRFKTGGSQKKVSASSHHPLAPALSDVVMRFLEGPDQ
jgi:hypothetical protein